MRKRDPGGGSEAGPGEMRPARVPHDQMEPPELLSGELRVDCFV
ncbi:hypothetical protein Acr_17g0010050 [Actinidia rufa]|uniref:Uncharacterized protein n=1 Tax=Actinidia rufa TaxID=165716 RepID=A0A7J0G3S3_9ERIC|nr:hypothetical protein Acr_17g0010050 [Actinidia rufa]